MQKYVNNLGLWELYSKWNVLKLGYAKPNDASLPSLSTPASTSQCFEIPGVKILSYQSPIYYGNRGFFRDAVIRFVGLDQELQQPKEDQNPDIRMKMDISTVVMFWVETKLWLLNSAQSSSHHSLERLLFWTATSKLSQIRWQLGVVILIR